MCRSVGGREGGREGYAYMYISIASPLNLSTLLACTHTHIQAFVCIFSCLVSLSRAIMACHVVYRWSLMLSLVCTLVWSLARMVVGEMECIVIYSIHPWPTIPPTPSHSRLTLARLSGLVGIATYVYSLFLLVRLANLMCRNLWYPWPTTYPQPH